MAPGVKAKVMYCKTEQVVSKKKQNGQYLTWCCNVVFTRHPTIKNQSHGIPYRTSLEPLTADGHLAVGHGRHHRVSRKLICRYLPQLNGLSQRDSNRGAPKMVMIHGLSASTISALGMPHFETKTACAASTKYPMDHCRSIPLTHGGSSGATSVVVNHCY